MPLHGQNSWRREEFGNARFSMLKRRKRRAPHCLLESVLGTWNAENELDSEFRVRAGFYFPATAEGVLNLKAAVEFDHGLHG